MNQSPADRAISIITAEPEGSSISNDNRGSGKSLVAKEGGSQSGRSPTPYRLATTEEPGTCLHNRWRNRARVNRSLSSGNLAD